MPNTTHSSLKFTGLIWKLILIILILRLPVHGQTVATYIPAEVVTNHVINVPANQAIRLYYYAGLYGCYLIKDGVSVTLRDNIDASSQTMIVQGPASFEFRGTNSPFNAYFIHQMIPSSSMVTKAYTVAEELVISVPAGKVLRFADAFYDPHRPGPQYTLTSATGITPPNRTLITSYESYRNFFLPGPVTFKTIPWTGEQSAPTQYITYYLAEDTIQVPEGALQVSGHTQVTIEKSADLSNWSAITVLEPPKEPKAFYRLKAAQ